MTTLRAAGIQPFGVNPASVAAHQRYVAKFAFSFPLLSDPEREVARAYEVLKPNGRGIRRTVYLIARDGTVRYAVRGAPPITEVIEALRGDDA